MHIQFDHCLDHALLEDIEKEIRSVLDDVRSAVQDWQKMRERMKECVTSIMPPKGRKSDGSVEEAKAFLEWLDDNNFT
ncbi:hypothetical protein ACEV9E_26065, partial [Vibrio parahaemolyticus]